jgi:D-3-phosphoglycerate dehydrogenase
VNQKEVFEEALNELGFSAYWGVSKQQLTEEELIELVPMFDGWILGDDPCTRAVLEAGKKGNLKAVVKWGVGTDNIDFLALQELEIPFSNTPGVFGKEVADLAMAYLISLSRHVVKIDSNVRSGEWIKPAGFSLADKNFAIVGFGDIGKNISKRLQASDVRVHVYEVDPQKTKGVENITVHIWPDAISEMDAVVLACALTPENVNIVNSDVLTKMKRGAIIVNVSRGGLINEDDLVDSLMSGQLGGVALDVYQVEPLPESSRIRKCDNVIFGTHNASNTVEAVKRTSRTSLELMKQFLSSDSRIDKKSI